MGESREVGEGIERIGRVPLEVEHEGPGDAPGGLCRRGDECVLEVGAVGGELVVRCVDREQLERLVEFDPGDERVEPAPRGFCSSPVGVAEDGPHLVGDRRLDRLDQFGLLGVAVRDDVGTDDLLEQRIDGGGGALGARGLGAHRAGEQARKLGLGRADGLGLGLDLRGRRSAEGRPSSHFLGNGLVGPRVAGTLAEIAQRGEQFAVVVDRVGVEIIDGGEGYLDSAPGREADGGPELAGQLIELVEINADRLAACEGFDSSAGGSSGEVGDDKDAEGAGLVGAVAALGRAVSGGPALVERKLHRHRATLSQRAARGDRSAEPLLAGR